MQNKSSLLPVNETFPAKNEKFLEKIVTALPSTTATLVMSLLKMRKFKSMRYLSNEFDNLVHLFWLT